MVVFTSQTAQAKNLAPPDDPTQSINYWKPHTLSQDKEPLVGYAEKIFSVLLRSWDSSRLEPSLYVVNSSSGPWAASLADGNILLSLDAIKTCLSFGKQRARHLLAFVLSHELSHQRADDLWHQRFFRLIGNQSPELRHKMLRGLNVDSKLMHDIEQKEAQADHDGLIMMASVGYDPYQILDKKDFFTAWVENIWGNSCRISDRQSAESQACKQAQTRALRARAQLSNVASQAMLYEMGVQRFIAGQYEQARRYFTAYGRQYPSRAVLSALGLSYLAQALQTQKTLIEKGLLQQPDFYYPLLLDANASATPQNKLSGKRGVQHALLHQQKTIIEKHVNQSIHYFEKAIKLEPKHAKTYHLLATSYLVAGNTFMARGVVQGKTIPQFGADRATDLLLAMTSALEGKSKRAKKLFKRLLKRLDKSKSSQALSQDLLEYASHYNYAALAQHLGDQKKADELWTRLANRSKTAGKSLLFRLALGQLKTNSRATRDIQTAPTIKGLRLGDPLGSGKQSRARATDLWIEGEQYQVLRYNDGSRFILGPDGKIVNAWLDSGSSRILNRVAMGDKADRPVKTLGTPTRHLHLSSGEYLAYDHYGLAIHVDQGVVSGWFLYNP